MNRASSVFYWGALYSFHFEVEQIEAWKSQKNHASIYVLDIDSQST